MTYQPNIEVETFADVSGLAFAQFTANTTAANDTKIPFASVTHKKGSSFVSVSSGSLVLASGYYYYLEGATQFELTAQQNQPGAQCVTSWKTSSGYVGSQGRSGPQTTITSDGELSVGDEKAIALIDATSGAVTVWFHCVTQTLMVRFNTNSAEYIYTGYGRATIIQLDPASEV